MKKIIRILCALTLACSLLCTALTLGVGATSQAGPKQGTAQKDYSALELIPGGIPFGVKFTTDGVLIVGFCDVENGGAACNPAKEAGLKLRDILTHVGEESITSADDLTAKINASGGAALSVRYTRGGKSQTTTLTPVLDTASGSYKTGLFVRDSGAGIGTVTFLVPKTNEFAGLGHGICDVDTGELMPLHRGNVVDVTISGINRGQAGSPGELRGYFGTGKRGTLLGNTACGVFGIYRELPEGFDTTAYPVGTRDQIHEGEATVLCTLASNERHSYTVRLSAIDKGADGSKCFSIQVTDPALLEQTGGIVQGMSGSPIIQDGKIVGAVTHVLINNPAAGYGIFIENMLAQMGKG